MCPLRPLTQAEDLLSVSAKEIFEHLTMERAISALERALLAGLKPEDSLARISVPLSHGNLLLMPAEQGKYAGVKIVSVAPQNPRHHLPIIQGNYLLLNSNSLRPLSVLDGAALTGVRTSALSALAVKYLAPPDAASLVVFGAGPQALHHIRAMAAVRDITNVSVVGRSPKRTADMLAQLRNEGLSVRPGTQSDVAAADIITCCTSSREPLFDGSLVPDNAVVVAMGSHEATAREVDDALLKRSVVYVEDIGTALREAGDVVIGIANGSIKAKDLRELLSLVRDRPVPPRKPALFKSVGMGWQDLITASTVYDIMIEKLEQLYT